MVGFHPGVRYPIELQFPWREASNGLSEDATSSLVLIGITKGDLDKELDCMLSKLIDNTKFPGTTSSLDE